MTKKDAQWELEKRQRKLRKLLDSRSKANCDTRNRSAADVSREQEIEELEAEIAKLETEIRSDS